MCCANNHQQSELFADTNFSQRLPFLLVGARLPAQPSVRGAFGGFALLKTVQNRIQGISLDSVLLGFLPDLLLMCRSRVHCHTPSAHVAFTLELLLQDLLVIAIYRKNFHVLQVCSIFATLDHQGSVWGQLVPPRILLEIFCLSVTFPEILKSCKLDF